MWFLFICLFTPPFIQAAVVRDPYDSNVVYDSKIFAEFPTESWKPYEVEPEWDENTFTTLPPSNISDLRVIGNPAQTAASGVAPYVCFVRSLDSLGATQTQCTGVLLSSSYVLTLASCVDNAYGIRVSCGSVDPPAPDLTMTPSVGNAYIFPLYKRNPRVHDLALVRAATPFTLDGTNIDQVSLPEWKVIDETKDILGGTSVRVFGFSGTDESADLVALQYVDTTVLSKIQCERAMRRLRYDPPFFTSCLDNQDGTVGVCKSERGAPVVRSTGAITNAVLLGIITEYFRCTDVPLFLRIRPYLPWIRLYVTRDINAG